MMLKILKLFLIFTFIFSNLHAQQTQFKEIRFKFFKNLINNFSTVERGKLYRSRQPPPKMLVYYIKKYGIRTIINLRGANTQTWYRTEAEIAKRMNVRLYNLKMSAKVLPSKENLLKLLKIYEAAEKPILIHCKSGADRTGEAAALWNLEQQHQSKQKAMKQLSINFLHFKNKYPAKDFLIKIWQGRQWLEKEYNPSNYPQFSK